MDTPMFRLGMGSPTGGRNGRSLTALKAAGSPGEEIDRPCRTYYSEVRLSLFYPAIRGEKDMKKVWSALSLLGLAAAIILGAGQEIDLLDLAAQGQWTSLSDQRLVFGRDGQELGTVKYEMGMVMEDGQRYERVLFAHPPWQRNGQLLGIFPDLEIPENAPRLKIAAGFNQGAAGTDGVTLEVRFMAVDTSEQAQDRRVRVSAVTAQVAVELCTLRLAYDRRIDQTECSLETFAGRRGDLILRLNAGNSADKDWVALTELKIVSAGAEEEAEAKQLVKNLKGHDGRLYSVRFSPDGEHVVTASADRTAKVWEVPSGRLTATLRGHGAHVFAADFSPNNRRVVTASGDGTARIWQAGSGSQLHELRGHTQAVLAAVFSPSGDQVATGGDDGMVKIWQAASGREIRTLDIASGGIYALSFHPNGRQLAVGSANGGLAVWNIISGQRIQAFQGHTQAVSSVAFNNTGNRLVSASNDDTAKVWNANNGNRIQNFGGQSFYAAVFSPNGRFVLTGNDGRATIWSAQDGGRLLTIRHVSAAAVRSVDYHRNSRYVVLAGEDGDARIWEVDLE